jgi:2',3'-cyclic-nucleotide 2'-phosphodiesterase
MNILFLGDVVGKVGRRIVSALLPDLKKELKADFVILNGENATHGHGLALKHYQEFKAAGVDCVTMGNHFFAVDEIMKKNDRYEDMLRPYNMNREIPGLGTKLFQVGDVKIRVTNLIGRVFIEGAESNPFTSLEDIISTQEKADIHIVDFHAEATGEKMSLARAFDGKVSAVLGTHTHVQTNDARILPNGTGFVSDAGMCGFYEGILGCAPDAVITKTWKGIPGRFLVPEDGKAYLCGVLLNVDEKSGLTAHIELVQRFLDINKETEEERN